jgi:hypothetical protein
MNIQNTTGVPESMYSYYRGNRPRFIYSVAHSAALRSFADHRLVAIHTEVLEAKRSKGTQLIRDLSCQIVILYEEFLCVVS